MKPPLGVVNTPLTDATSNADLIDALVDIAQSVTIVRNNSMSPKHISDYEAYLVIAKLIVLKRMT